MRETFTTIVTPKGFLARMNSQMFLQMMLKFEGFVTVGAFKLPQIIGLIVTQHVTLQTINIRKCFATNCTTLKIDRKRTQNSISLLVIRLLKIYFIFFSSLHKSPQQEFLLQCTNQLLIV